MLALIRDSSSLHRFEVDKASGGEAFDVAGRTNFLTSSGDVLSSVRSVVYSGQIALKRRDVFNGFSRTLYFIRGKKMAETSGKRVGVSRSAAGWV